jgi:hypothetical protein
MLIALQAGALGKIVVDWQDRFGAKDAYQWGRFMDLQRKHSTSQVDADGRCPRVFSNGR